MHGNTYTPATGDFSRTWRCPTPPAGAPAPSSGTPASSTWRGPASPSLGAPTPTSTPANTPLAWTPTPAASWAPAPTGGTPADALLTRYGALTLTPRCDLPVLCRAAGARRGAPRSVPVTSFPVHMLSRDEQHQLACGA
jgi:hypothetical protein